MISITDNDGNKDSTWNQILQDTPDVPGSPNNTVMDEVVRYLKKKLASQKVDPLTYWQRK